MEETITSIILGLKPKRKVELRFRNSVTFKFRKFQGRWIYEPEPVTSFDVNTILKTIANLVEDTHGIAYDIFMDDEKINIPSGLQI